MISRRSILFQSLSLAAGAAAAWLIRDRLLWPGPTAKFGAGETASGWLDFTAPRQLLPVLPVTVRGATVEALLDSGAERSVIDAAVARRLGLGKGLGLPMVAFGVGGSAQLGYGANLDLAIGGISLQDLHAVILPLGPIASAEGLGAALVLGQDVLRQLIADIDFPARRIQFHARETYLPPPQARPAPVTPSGGALKVAVEVNGAPLQAVLDTGASAALSLSTGLARRLGLLDQAQQSEAVSIVLGGAIRSQVVEASSVAFAGETLRDAPVQIYAERPLPVFPQAVLGVEALRRLRVILDYGDHRMLLIRAGFIDSKARRT